MAFLASRSCLTVLRKGEEPFHELSLFVLSSWRKLPCAVSLAVPPLCKISFWDFPCRQCDNCRRLSKPWAPFLFWNGQLSRQSSKVCHETLSSEVNDKTVPNDAFLSHSRKLQLPVALCELCWYTEPWLNSTVSFLHRYDIRVDVMQGATVEEVHGKVHQCWVSVCSRTALWCWYLVC